MSDSIFVDVQGTKVEGRLVHRSRADIVVEIVSPYGGMTDARHIPYFAMGDPANDFRGPLGDARAASLLTGLYLLARFVEENQGAVEESSWRDGRGYRKARPGAVPAREQVP